MPPYTPTGTDVTNDRWQERGDSDGVVPASTTACSRIPKRLVETSMILLDAVPEG